MPRDVQEDSRFPIKPGSIHPDRLSQIVNTIYNINDLELDGSEPDQLLRIDQSIEQSIQQSRKERKRITRYIEPLSHTTSGKVIAKPLSKKQRNYLQSIPKSTIPEYLDKRKLDLWPCTQYLLMEYSHLGLVTPIPHLEAAFE